GRSGLGRRSEVRDREDRGGAGGDRRRPRRVHDHGQSGRHGALEGDQGPGALRPRGDSALPPAGCGEGGGEGAGDGRRGLAMAAGSMHRFRIEVPRADLDDLRERLGRTRWPGDLDNDAWRYGTNEAFLRALVAEWQEYDWRPHERAMNEFEHYRVELRGQPVHYLHV